MSKSIKITQYFLGAILIISGLIKLNDPLGFAYKLEEYYSYEVFDLPFLMKYALSNGFVISLMEVILGVGIIQGYKITKTLLLSIAMFVFFGFLTFYSAYFNKVTDCGCFGDAIHFTPWQSFTKDMILLAIAIFLWKQKHNILEKSKSIIIIGTFIFFGTTLAVYSYNNLPVIDFRPYKIGANIPELMSVPEGAAEDVYIETWHYKVDGKVNEYTTEDAPWNIKGAEFVARETKLVSKGYVPPIHDFSLDINGFDQTQEILSKEDILCIFSVDIKKLNNDDVKNIKKLLEKNDNAIMATSSSDTDIDNFIKSIEMPVKIYIIDGTTCKTIVRANPGVVRLKKGVVVEKYAL